MQKASKKYVFFNLDTSSSETTISEKMTELYFDSIDDLAGYLIAYKDKEESLLFTLSSQKNPSEELTMYTPAFIPNDYELSVWLFHFYVLR